MLAPGEEAAPDADRELRARPGPGAPRPRAAGAARPAPPLALRPDMSASCLGPGGRLMSGPWRAPPRSRQPGTASPGAPAPRLPGTHQTVRPRAQELCELHLGPMRAGGCGGERGQAAARAGAGAAPGAPCSGAPAAAGAARSGGAGDTAEQRAGAAAAAGSGKKKRKSRADKVPASAAGCQGVVLAQVMHLGRGCSATCCIPIDSSQSWLTSEVYHFHILHQANLP